MIQFLSTSSGKRLLFLIAFLIATDLAILLDIPVLRQFLGFFFFTTIPGLLLVYIMKLNRLGLTEKIVVSVGLSVAFTMFFGLAINSLLLAVGYSTPLSTISVTVSFSIAIIVLSIIAYLRNKDTSFSFPSLGLTTGEKAFLVVASLFPLLSIAGMRLMNLTDNNALLLALLFLIIVYVLLVSVYHRRVSARLYPSLIFFMSISLLLMFSLRSNHILGSDTTLEYYVFQITSDRLFWSTGVAGGAMDVVLAVSVLPTVYQSFLNIDPEYLFKVFYSLIVSILPVVIYLLSKKYIGSFYAFLASIFFMSQTVFMWTAAEVRSNTAVLFLALAIMVLFHDGISEFNKRVLYIVFTTSALASHYSTSYVFLFILLLVVVLVPILATISSRKKHAGQIESSAAVAKAAVPDSAPLKRGITVTGVALFFAMLFLWYSQVTGVAFKDGVRFIQNSLISLQEMFIAETRGPGVQQVIFGHVPPYQEAWLLRVEIVLTWFTILFMAIGLLAAIRRFGAMVSTPFSRQEKPGFLVKKLDLDIFAISAASFILLVTAVALPYVSTSYGIGRTYFLAMVPLSIFFVLGGITVARYLKLSPRLIICLVLIPYFMSTTGLTYQLFDFPRAVTLNSAGYYYDTMYVHDQESYAIKWLAQNKEERVTVFSERIRLLQGQSPILREDIRSLILASKEGTKIEDYIYLRYMNVVEGKYTGSDQLKHDLSQEFPDMLVGMNKLYANGGSEVYRTG